METVIPTEVIGITQGSRREPQHSREIKEAGGVQTWSMKYDMCHKQRLRPRGFLPTDVLPRECSLAPGRMCTHRNSEGGEAVNLLPLRATPTVSDPESGEDAA